MTAEIQREVATRGGVVGRVGGGEGERKLQNAFEKGRHPTPSKGTESGPAGRLPSAGGGSGEGGSSSPPFSLGSRSPFCSTLRPATAGLSARGAGAGTDGVAQGHLHAGWGVGATRGPSPLAWAMAEGRPPGPACEEKGEGACPTLGLDLGEHSDLLLNRAVWGPGNTPRGPG